MTERQRRQLFCRGVIRGRALRACEHRESERNWCRGHDRRGCSRQAHAWRRRCSARAAGLLLVRREHRSAVQSDPPLPGRYTPRPVEPGLVTGLYRDGRVHRIHGDEKMLETGVSGEIDAQWDFLTYLRDPGRQAAAHSPTNTLTTSASGAGLPSTLSLRRVFVPCRHRIRRLQGKANSNGRCLGSSPRAWDSPVRVRWSPAPRGTC